MTELTVIKKHPKINSTKQPHLTFLSLLDCWSALNMERMSDFQRDVMQLKVKLEEDSRPT